MKLNKRLAGLPKWPFISKIGEDKFLVEGRHISYWRYLMARWLFNISAMVGFYFLGNHIYTEHEHWQFATIALLGYFVGYAVFTMAVPMPRILCWFLLRQQTLVHISKSGIALGSKYFKILPEVTIQFRANVDSRAEYSARGKQPREGRYLIGFHVVEMIYGLRPIRIASIDSEYWANQFAVALQYAYETVKAPANVAPQATVPQMAVADDDLPE